MHIVGSPLGSPDHRQAKLRDNRRGQDVLLERIPHVPSLQSAWLLLFFCGSPRSNYLLRVLPPSCTAVYAQEHDAAVLRCLGTLLGNDIQGQHAQRALLAMRSGGLGLRSAQRLAPAAYWASWADSLAMLRAKHPQVAERIAQQLERLQGVDVPVLRELADAAAALLEDGFVFLPWRDLMIGARPPLEEEEEGAQGEPDAWARG